MTETATIETMMTESEAETIRAGTAFARRLGPGSVVALSGELGTGKTRFVKGICAGLGVTRPVSSPTFTIVNEYRGTALRVFHFDFYRLNSGAELGEIGFDEYLAAGGVCLIEWADRLPGVLPPSYYDIRFEYGPGEFQRSVSIRQAGTEQR